MYTRRPIIPSTQHESVFYGLAKASGDTTQSQSSNAVGTYTNAAKGAIKSMLGVTDPTVTDVQVNGTSVVTNGVADIPIVTSNGSVQLGLVKPMVGLGTAVASNGGLAIVKASDAQIKTGTNEYVPIVPQKQHISTFYGLAKLAGVDMKNSSNSVGQYTDEAKVAIQKMLGIYEPPFELITQMTLSERSLIDITTDMNGQPFALRSLIMEIYYPANLEQESSGYGRFRVYDADGKSLNTETSKYTGLTNTAYKLLYFERKSNLVLANYTRVMTTGNSGGWYIKSSTNAGTPGFRLDLGDIVRIAAVSGDYEPAGAVVTIYGQRAY